ncbi:MAG: RNA-protein complex protein Nop10 [Thermoplasmatota archaeon]
MRSRIKRCGICRMYTLKDHCPKCGEPTGNTFPPRYSPADKYGKYRRMALGLEGSDGD